MASDDTLLVVCGSRRQPSRTRTLANVAADVAAEAGVPVERLDLRDRPMELFDGRNHGEYDEPTIDAVSTFLDADTYVIASPVYFGGISGALKNLIDHVPYERFRERPRVAGLLMTGRDDRHRLVLDAHLRATLVYMGVDVATTGVFATEDHFDGFTLAEPAVESYVESMVAETLALRDDARPTSAEREP